MAVRKLFLDEVFKIRSTITQRFLSNEMYMTSESSRKLNIKNYFKIFMLLLKSS